MLAERLRDVPFLRGVPPSALPAVADRCHDVRVAPGELLFAAGDPSDAVYVVADGWLLVVGANGQELAEVGPGSVVGEVGLLLDAPRSAGVKAITEAHLWCLDRDDVDALIAEYPQVGVALGREVGHRLLNAEDRAVTLAPRIVVVAGPDSFHLAAEISAVQTGVAVLGLDGTRDWRDIPEDVSVVLGTHATPQALVELATRPARDVNVVVVALPAEATPAGLAAVEVADHAVDLGRGLPAWSSQRLEPLRRLPAPRRADELRRIARWCAGKAVGLALSSGGSKTVAHVGVVQVLREAGVPFDAIAGTSGGSVVGSAVAFGLTHDELLTRLRELPEAFRYRRLGPRVPPRDGLFSGGALREMFDRWWPRADVAEALLPLYVVAADVRTGQEVVLRRGPVADAVRASMGIPGVFSPVPWEGRWLTDGGIVTPLPARVLRDAGFGVVLASNVAGQDPRPREGERAPRLVDTLGRIVSTLERQVLAGQVSQADVVIRPVVQADHSFDFGRIEEYLEEGRRAAEAALPAITQALGRS